MIDVGLLLLGAWVGYHGFRIFEYGADEGGLWTLLGIAITYAGLFTGGVGLIGIANAYAEGRLL